MSSVSAEKRSPLEQLADELDRTLAAYTPHLDAHAVSALSQIRGGLLADLKASGFAATDARLLRLGWACTADAIARLLESAGHDERERVRMVAALWPVRPELANGEA